MDNQTFEPDSEPTRADIDKMPGPVLLEFGAEWCSYCNALRPHLAKLSQEFPQVRHIRIEDGQGLPLGRSFGVKLWPTFIFMRWQLAWLSRELVRPAPAAAILQWFRGNRDEIAYLLKSNGRDAIEPQPLRTYH